nr:MAG TPA: hypothetical protein [Caudoviricetes sp.]
MRFFERPGGFIEIIIPQFVQKEKPTCTANASRQYLSIALTARKTRTIILYHTSSILSIIFSLLPIDVRQYGTRAAISTWHSWSTYRNRAIFRSYLPSGARFITAFICSALSPCNAGGKTTRAAATGSTEPERFGQLSGVAHHSAKHGKPVTKRHQFVDIAEMVCFREATKTSVCDVHFVGVNKMLVCSACHDILLTAFVMPPVRGQRKTESRFRWFHR